MEDKYDEFDTLLIKSNKSSGLKKILLIFAVLLLILILIILVTKILVEPQNRAQPSIKLPPEPISEEASIEKDPLFKQVPIIEDNQEKNKIEETLNRAKDSIEEVDESVSADNTNKNPADTKKELGNREFIVQEKTSDKEVSIKQKVSPSTVKKQTFLKKYYIQVGAFFKHPPEKKFLENIKKGGFNYIVVDAKKGEISYKKVLVGPFESRENASKMLPTIKKRINQNAYITRAK